MFLLLFHIIKKNMVQYLYLAIFVIPYQKNLQLYFIIIARVLIRNICAWLKNTQGCSF